MAPTSPRDRILEALLKQERWEQLSESGLRLWRIIFRVSDLSEEERAAYCTQFYDITSTLGVPPRINQTPDEQFVGFTVVVSEDDYKERIEPHAFWYGAGRADAGLFLNKELQTTRMQREPQHSGPRVSALPSSTPHIPGTLLLTLSCSGLML